MGQDRYITLVSSLPALGPMLAAKTPPINRDRLTARLRSGLAPGDHAQLDSLSSVLDWARVQNHAADADAVAAARAAERSLASPVLRIYLRDRMELRTTIAALRRRARGEGPPPEDAPWGFGRYLRRIRAHWSDPGFGVTRAFPWVPEAARKLEAGEAAAMERIVLEAAWRQAERRGALHRFDLEAVVFYVARWALLERWTRYDAQAAEMRFADLMDRALPEAAR